jgi:hypothetical protein
MHKTTALLAVAAALAVPAPAAASVRLVGIDPQPAYRGNPVTLTARVSPRNVICSIGVHYKSGWVNGKGTETEATADQWPRQLDMARRDADDARPLADRRRLRPCGNAQDLLQGDLSRAEAGRPPLARPWPFPTARDVARSSERTRAAGRPRAARGERLLRNRRSRRRRHYDPCVRTRYGSG